MSDSPVDWNTVNNLVASEYQYKDANNPPLDPIRMAWPFKTEGELHMLRQWFYQEQLKLKKENIESVGEATL